MCVQVTPETLRAGDVVFIGERPFTVARTAPLGSGGARVSFSGGERFTFPRHASLTALRAEPRRLRPEQPLPGGTEILAQVLVGCGLVAVLCVAVVR